MKYFIGACTGWLACALIFAYMVLTGKDICTTVSESTMIKYEAYRECIKRHDCLMTAEDWIRYYEAKWEIEELDGE